MKRPEHMKNNHLENEQILAYLKAANSSEHSQTRLHLAVCETCRQQTDLTARLRDQGHCLETAVPVESQIESRVESLISGELSPEAAEALRAELKQDPATLRSALHYATHGATYSASQSSSRVGNPDTAASTAPRWNPLSILKEWLNWQAPLWQIVPAASVVVAIVAVMLNPALQNLSSGENRIVAFQDNPTIQMTSNESQPGIGFFAQNEGLSLPFSGMEISLEDGDKLGFSWPEVDDVQNYRLKLQVFRDGVSEVLARVSTTDNMAQIDLTAPISQHRFEWVLSGETSDNRSFQTKGGFVIGKH